MSGLRITALSVGCFYLGRDAGKKKVQAEAAALTAAASVPEAAAQAAVAPAEPSADELLARLRKQTDTEFARLREELERYREGNAILYNYLTNGVKR